MFKLKTYTPYGLKHRPTPSKKNCVICLIENPLKMMKNVGK